VPAVFVPAESRLAELYLAAAAALSAPDAILAPHARVRLVRACRRVRTSPLLQERGDALYLVDVVDTYLSEVATAFSALAVRRGRDTMAQALVPAMLALSDIDPVIA
jgi:hypothetical protein